MIVIDVFACVYICVPCLCLVSMKAKRGDYLPETKAAGFCELPRGHREPNPDLLQEQQKSSLAEPSLILYRHILAPDEMPPGCSIKKTKRITNK